MKKNLLSLLIVTGLIGLGLITIKGTNAVDRAHQLGTFQERAKMAVECGIVSDSLQYRGTKEQNIALVGCDLRLGSGGEEDTQTQTTIALQGSPGAWQNLFTNTLTPTNTSAGIFVRASSTIDANLRVNNDFTIQGGGEQNVLLTESSSNFTGVSTTPSNLNSTFQVGSLNGSAYSNFSFTRGTGYFYGVQSTLSNRHESILNVIEATSSVEMGAGAGISLGGRLQVSPDRNSTFVRIKGVKDHPSNFEGRLTVETLDGDGNLYEQLSLNNNGHLGVGLGTGGISPYPLQVKPSTQSSATTTLNIIGNSRFEGNATTTMLNGVAIVEGVTYPRTSVGINNALAAVPAGGKVELTCGTYTITAGTSITISSSDDGKILLGNGHCTNIVNNNTDGTHSISLTSGASDFEIGNMKFTGTVSSGVGDIVHGVSANAFKLHDLYSDSVGEYGFWCQHCSSNTIENVHFSNTRNDAFFVKDSSHANKFINPHSTGAGGAGIHILGTSNNQIYGLISEDDFGGIILEGASSVLITNPYIEFSDLPYSIYIDEANGAGYSNNPSKDVSIQGGYIFKGDNDATKKGIQVAKSGRIRIEGVQFEHSSSAGIWTSFVTVQGSASTTDIIGSYATPTEESLFDFTTSTSATLSNSNYNKRVLKFSDQRSGMFEIYGNASTTNDLIVGGKATTSQLSIGNVNPQGTFGSGDLFVSSQIGFDAVNANVNAIEFNDGSTLTHKIVMNYSGSGDTGNDLSFDTFSKTNALVIERGGNIGIGTGAPTYLFQITDGTNTMFSVSDAGTTGNATTSGTLVVGTTNPTVDMAAGSAWFGDEIYTPNMATNITGNGVCRGTAGQLSDAGAAACIPSNPKIKHDMKPSDSEQAIKDIMSIQPIDFVYNKGIKDDGNYPYPNENGERVRLGFDAWQLMSVDPRLADGYIREDKKSESVDFIAILNRLVLGFQKLFKSDERQDQRIEELERQIEELRGMIEGKKYCEAK